jgi:hypothetical protein
MSTGSDDRVGSDDHTEHDWLDEPDLPDSPSPDPLPLDGIPHGVRAHIESVRDYLQVPAELPLMLGLAAVSAAVAGRVVVRVKPGWTEPVGIYTVCILPPASRKSPAYSAMVGPLRECEAESISRAFPAVLKAQDAVEVAEDKLQKAKKKVVNSTDGSMDEVENARSQLERAQASIPPDGRLLAGDITPEAMVVRMVAQGGRLAILEPEPGPLQVLAGRYSDAPHFDEVKKAWSEEEIIVDRINRPPLRVPRPSLTLALLIQPGVIQALGKNREAFRNEGVFGRFLWCHPKHGLGTRLTGAAVPPPNEAANEAFVRIVRTLWGLRPRSHDDAGVPQPHVIHLSSDALEVLHAFEAEVELQLRDGGCYAGIRDWAGKMVGQSVRIAAILELAARAGEEKALIDGPISSRSMEKAVSLVRALGSHALAVLGATDGHAALLVCVLGRARDLVNEPPGDEKGGPSLRNLYELTKGRATISSMDDLKPLVDELIERGCLRLITLPTDRPGRPPSPIVEVHPSIRTIRTNRAGDAPAVTPTNGNQRPAPREHEHCEQADLELDDLLRVEVRQ